MVVGNVFAFALLARPYTSQRAPETQSRTAHSTAAHTLSPHTRRPVFSNITVNTFAPGRLGRHEPPWPWPLRAPGWLCLRRPHPICQGLLAALFSHGLFVGEQTEASREKQTEVQEEDGCGHVQQAWLKQ